MRQRNHHIRPESPTARVIKDVLGVLLIFAFGAALWIVAP